MGVIIPTSILLWRPCIPFNASTNLINSIKKNNKRFVERRYVWNNVRLTEFCIADGEKFKEEHCLMLLFWNKFPLFLCSSRFVLCQGCCVFVALATVVDDRTRGCVSLCERSCRSLTSPFDKQRYRHPRCAFAENVIKLVRRYTLRNFQCHCNALLTLEAQSVCSCRSIEKRNIYLRWFELSYSYIRTDARVSLFYKQPTPLQRTRWRVVFSGSISHYTGVLLAASRSIKRFSSAEGTPSA